MVTRETHPVFRRGDRLVVVGYDGKRKGELRLVSVSRFDPTEEQRNAVTTGYPSLLSKASYKLGFRLKVKQMPFEIGPGDVVSTPTPSAADSSSKTTKWVTYARAES